MGFSDRHERVKREVYRLNWIDTSAEGLARLAQILTHACGFPVVASLSWEGNTPWNKPIFQIATYPLPIVGEEP